MEIKFRAWLPTENMMVKGDLLYPSISLGGRAYWKENGKEIRSDVIIMQFTGIKDKYCKEIYEGDILSSLKYNIYSQIRINAGHTSFEAISLSGNKYWKHLFQNTIKNWDFIIVGNIYENPELLATPHK